MSISMQAFYLPKAGNSAEEYEDAFWPQESGDRRFTQRFRCAVADGATETSFSGLWANQLAQAYCRQPTIRKFVEGLPLLQQEWRERVNSKPLPWYAEEKVRSGAFAALLGLTLRRAPEGRKYPILWDALAIGDCCLFQIRQGSLLQAFPLEQADEFNNRPFLLGTRPFPKEQMDDHVALLGGGAENDDRFYLMSDALACWFLRLLEAGEDGVARIESVATQSDFEALARETRPLRDRDNRPFLRNDDMTLLRLAVTL